MDCVSTSPISFSRSPKRCDTSDLVTLLIDCPCATIALSTCTDGRKCYPTDPLDDIAFAVFAIAWVPTRHFLMLRILVSIVEVSPRVMSCGATIWEVVSGAVAESCPSTWDYSMGYYWNGEVMIPICAESRALSSAIVQYFAQCISVVHNHL